MSKSTAETALRPAAGDGAGRPDPAAAASPATSCRPIPPAAQRALAEAEARRQAAAAATPAKEIGGRDGPDPVRYGDWEKGGILSDF